LHDELQRKLLLALREIASFYEKANTLMSLFTLNYIRKEAARLVRSRGYNRVLDAGCGPGVMTKHFLNGGSSARLVVGLDPLEEMLVLFRAEVEKTGQLAECVRGVFEYMPFRSGCFDLLFTAFALRDAKNILKALLEFARVLKKGSRALILDLGKPRKPFLREALSLYIRIVPRIVGMLLAGWKGYRIYSTLYDTYEIYPSTPRLLLMARKTIGSARAYYLIFGGSCIILCKKNCNMHAQSREQR